ncbi:MAG: hypothetical protein WAO08_36260 [Hyphomicrobiaceae bacterium]
MAAEFPRATVAEMAGQTVRHWLRPTRLAALLPPRARLEILTLRREDAHKLVPLRDDVRALSAERFNMERALQKLLAPAAEGGHLLHPDDLRVVVFV